MRAASSTMLTVILACVAAAGSRVQQVPFASVSFWQGLAFPVQICAPAQPLSMFTESQFSCLGCDLYMLVLWYVLVLSVECGVKHVNNEL